MTTYQTYQAPEATEESPGAVQTHSRAGNTSITVVNGEAVTEHSGNAQYNTGELGVDTYGADDWRSTARNKFGNPTATITRDSLVTLGGVQGRVSDFVGAGVLREASAGVFEIPSQGEPKDAAQDAPQGDPDAATMPEELATAVGTALASVPDHAMPLLRSVAASSMAGLDSPDAIAQRIVTASGMAPAEAKVTADFLTAVYRQQAGSYLVSQGIAPEDLEMLTDYAKQDPSRMQRAILNQLNGDMRTWREIVNGFNSSTPPTAAALAANGRETRTINGKTEVHVGHGIWTSLAAAAKGGFV